MWISLFVFGLLFFGAVATLDEIPTDEYVQPGVFRLKGRIVRYAPPKEVPLTNENVRAIIKHFKQPDPRGLPEGLDHYIPDPMPLPDMQHDFSGIKVNFKNMTIHGQRLVRLDHVRSDLSSLKVSAGVSLDQLKMLGLYSMSAFWSRSSGNFSVFILNVAGEAEGEFDVSPEGHLRVKEINMDIKFQDIKLKFEGLGWMASMFQGIVNSIGAFLFDSIKPIILKEVKVQLYGTLNRKAREVPQQFPNSVNPLDMALSATREYMKKQGLDPLPLPDYKTDYWSSSFELTNGQMEGLSTIHRTGTIAVGFDNNTIHVNVNVGAENLKGQYNWSWGVVRSLLSRQGEITFTVQHVKIGIQLQQPANLDLMPSIDNLDLDIGNIAVLSEGAGTVDYIVEAAFNILPNIFRKQIIQALEVPVCKAVEEEIRKLKLEAMIEQQLTS